MVVQNLGPNTLYGTTIKGIVCDKIGQWHKRGAKYSNLTVLFSNIGSSKQHVMPNVKDQAISVHDVKLELWSTSNTA